VDFTPKPEYREPYQHVVYIPKPKGTGFMLFGLGLLFCTGLLAGGLANKKVMFASQINAAAEAYCDEQIAKDSETPFGAKLTIAMCGAGVPHAMWRTAAENRGVIIIPF
jgi:putative NADPH-quinone reductase